MVHNSPNIITSVRQNAVRKSREVRAVPGWTSVRKQGKPKYLKNTPEDGLDTFCDIISHLTSNYRLDFLGLRKLLDRTCPDFDDISSRLSYYIAKSGTLLCLTYLT